MRAFLLSCRLVAVFVLCSRATLAQTDPPSSLPGTRALIDLPEDPAAAMVAGLDRFALRQLELAAAERPDFWRAPSSKQENLAYLKSRLGLPAARKPFPNGSFLKESAPLATTDSIVINAVRWPVLAHPAPQLRNSISLWGAGILIEPLAPMRGLAILLPDADESPEQYLGIDQDPDHRGAQRQELVGLLAKKDFAVLIPRLVSRTIMQHGNASLSRREYLHRAAFELGATLVGYEVQMVQAAIDQFATEGQIVCGFGEGGMLALYSAAIDDRIDTAICCGYFGPRGTSWSEPLSRNAFGVFSRFADAELGAMLAPRRLIVSDQPAFSVSLKTNGGAPADWTSPEREGIEREFARMLQFANDQLGVETPFATLADASEDNINKLLDEVLNLDAQTSGDPSKSLSLPGITDTSEARELRLMATIDAHTQAVLEESEYTRSRFLNIGLERLNASDGTNVIDATSEEAYVQSIERFRTKFAEQVIGKFDELLLPPMARTKQNYRGHNWTGYDVVLDVYPDVFAYGVLLLPDGMKANEKRPVVVCQHGLEGRPQDIISGDHYAYHDFAAKLAERGFIVFAPQNPYIGKDDFRTLQRKLNPIGKTLFSVISSQHEQILSWLSSLSNVDADRIAFYGLSYGGKSAMRLPALLPQYCLSICSADFNDWVWKNASSRSPYSYVGTGEYEIFEFNLGKTFNYAEMAALIAPRPFMVERGHFDGVAPDERVAREFAKVRFLYAARLSLPDRCEIEFFKGPHTINGNGTFKFLHQHLNWPEP